MIRITLVCICLCLLCSCTVLRDNPKNWDKLIEGTWQIDMPAPIFYQRMELRKGGAVIYTTGDTIFMYAYQVKKYDFLLRDRNGVEIHNNILKLTKDSLIFSTFLEENTPQIFVRRIIKE